jgi:thioester reductase-like protein
VSRQGKQESTVVLTGATGWLGSHLLTELLRCGGVEVICIVRAESDEAASKRLSAAVGHQLGAVPDFGGRVTAVAGDLTATHLGLSSAAMCRIADVDLVIHAAADTRLIAPPAELARVNVEGTQNLLDWLDRHVSTAAFHHISTLAVAGAVTGTKRRFSEDDLDIGQDFLTPYERSKYEGEQLIRKWRMRGRTASIYRTGHIAAHSVTGRFQRNIADNRVYQIVKWFAQTGAAPESIDSAFAFSYVDVVAKALVTLSLTAHADLSVYHVESPHEVSRARLREWLMSFGFPPHPTVTNSSDIHLGHLWTQREDRNVEFDSDQTLHVLAGLDITFPEPDEAWFHRTLSHGVDVGFLPGRQRTTC